MASEQAVTEPAREESQALSLVDVFTYVTYVNSSSSHSPFLSCASEDCQGSI